MADYIPAADAALGAWAANFSAYLSANAVALGLTAGEALVVADLRSDYAGKYADHLAALSAAQGAREAKEASKRGLKEAVRKLVRRLQASAVVTDAQRQAMGLRVIVGSGRALVGAPVTRPVVSVDTSQRLRHVLRFVDEQAAPGRRAKPVGVSGCEVWSKLGDDAPVDEEGCAFVGRATRATFTVDYSAADARKPAHYLLRWVNARGQPGPWSAVTSATVAG